MVSWGSWVGFSAVLGVKCGEHAASRGIWRVQTWLGKARLRQWRGRIQVAFWIYHFGYSVDRLKLVALVCFVFASLLQGDDSLPPAFLCACMLSRVRVFGTSWTVARQTPLSMGFPRQEYWSRLPCPPPGDLPDPGIQPEFPVSPSLTGRFLMPEPPTCSQLEKELKWKAGDAV